MSAASPRSGSLPVVRPTSVPSPRSALQDRPGAQIRPRRTPGPRSTPALEVRPEPQPAPRPRPTTRTRAARVRRAAPTRGARAVVWLAAHLLIGVVPLALCSTQLMPGRGFVVNLSIALGFVALSVLGLQFALAARLSRATAPFGIDAVLRYHRQISFLAVAAALGHPVLLFLTADRYRALLDVVHAPLRAQLAWASVGALVVLMVTSIWRRALRLSYAVWHVLHSALGVLIVLAALGHAFLVNYYFSEPWVRLVWALYAAAFLWLAVWVRLVKPLRLWRRPWRVAELWPEPGGSVTVGVEPAYRHGGHGFSFQAGQFAWILSGRTPFTLTYHPFSMSSSAVSSRVEFTIKRVGQFTSSVRELKVGDTVYVDGPHGSFTLQRHPGLGYVFLGTGAGVTPFLSMLATMADQGDQRPCWLFLGNAHEGQITGIRQLARLQGRLNLTVVHVISRPGESWTGERGRIDHALLDRYLPEHWRALQYFLCAREEVVDALEQTLLGLDVPAERIHSERFGMV
ncbi:MAG: oxidoreductase FAD/NAD(P)-binding domain protein [Modestobacter sp.]|jgi:predicted ferric reductase|nr:oxidoreductase FAD/NAD(P)-binding domain protein [Modestobacter sp.]